MSKATKKTMSAAGRQAIRDAQQRRRKKEQAGSLVIAKAIEKAAAIVEDQVEQRFASGAKRSEIAPMYHLIPPEAKLRLAKRYAMGVEKYGMLNYLKGINDPAFVRQVIDHLEAHLEAFKKSGCKLDHNLAAIMWGAATLIVIEEHNPSIIDHIVEARNTTIQAALTVPRSMEPLFVGSKSLIEE